MTSSFLRRPNGVGPRIAPEARGLQKGASKEGEPMLLTPSGTETRVYQFVRQRDSLRATAEEIAEQVGGDVHDTRLALDELVARNELRRFERPGAAAVYWS